MGDAKTVPRRMLILHQREHLPKEGTYLRPLLGEPILNYCGHFFPDWAMCLQESGTGVQMWNNSFQLAFSKDQAEDSVKFGDKYALVNQLEAVQTEWKSTSL